MAVKKAAPESTGLTPSATRLTTGYRVSTPQNLWVAVALFNLLVMPPAAFAEEQFRKSLSDPGTPEREKAPSHLHLGQIFDLQGKRSQAIQQYQSVLKCQEYDNSRVTAREF